MRELASIMRKVSDSFGKVRLQYYTVVLRLLANEYKTLQSSSNIRLSVALIFTSPNCGFPTTA